MDEKSKTPRKEAMENLGEEDDIESEFEENALFEWANELNEEHDLELSIADYKHKIDYLY